MVDSLPVKKRSSSAYIIKSVVRYTNYWWVLVLQKTTLSKVTTRLDHLRTYLHCELNMLVHASISSSTSGSTIVGHDYDESIQSSSCMVEDHKDDERVMMMREVSRRWCCCGFLALFSGCSLVIDSKIGPVGYRLNRLQYSGIGAVRGTHHPASKDYDIFSLL